MTLELARNTLFAGDFRILQRLSAGGMGAVYVAEQLSTRKLRALKLMHGGLLADEASRRRFEQEARVAARIPSEHVVEVQAAGIDPQSGLPYLVMELLEGETLEAMVRRRGPLRPAEARTVLEQICHAVGAAHQAGIVHRDLKPLNVFMARARRTDVAITVKLLDFGIAKLLSEATTQTAGMGSPLWLAPEQAGRGHVTPATDVWALGLVAYFLLTGRPFWASAELSIPQVMREVLFDPIPPASVRAAERGVTLPLGFDTWFARCLCRDFAGRFADARQAFAQLAALLPPGGVLGPEFAAPLGACAALQAGDPSAQLVTGSPGAASWESRTGWASVPSWGTGSPEASRSRATGRTSHTTSRSSAFASAPAGLAVGCLVAAMLTSALGLAFGIGVYFVAGRVAPGPSAAASHDPGVSVSGAPISEIATSQAPTSSSHGVTGANGVSPVAAGSIAARPSSPTFAAPTRTEAPPRTADNAAPTPARDERSAPKAAPNAAAVVVSPDAQRPSEALAWDIGRAVQATGFKPCLYSQITLPNHGTFATRPSVTVRFDGTRLLGIEVQGSSTYPAADLVNRSTFKPATQAEVDAELGRVLSCIRAKVGAVRIPPNQARGTVVNKFSGSDLYGAAVL